jgi:hypothetical protein
MHKSCTKNIDEIDTLVLKNVKMGECCDENQKKIRDVIY